MFWPWVVANWQIVGFDLQRLYGIDVEDENLMRSHRWSWLKLRVDALRVDEKSIVRHWNESA